MRAKLDPKQYARLKVTIPKSGETRLARVQTEDGRDVPCFGIELRGDVSGHLDVTFRVPLDYVDVELSDG